MNVEKWEEIKGLVKDKFVIEEEEVEELEDVPGGTVEYITFEGPLGRMRLEFVTKPVLLEQKTLGSRRIGSETAVQNVYSEDEFTHTFKAYQWSDTDEEWVAMEQEKNPFQF